MEEENVSLAGKILKVTTVENMPLSGSTLENGNLVGDGKAFRILELMEKTLNFSHVLVSSSNPADLRGDVDFVSAFLPIPRKPGEMIYSTPIAVEKWVLLMKRPEESLIGSGLLAPFTLEVWILTLSALLLMGPLIYSIIKLRHQVLRPAGGVKCRVLQLRECVWFTYGAIMKQGSPLDPSDDTTRLLFATWWIFITILTSYYTANLTAFLTLSRFTLPLEHPADLVENNLKWFGKSGGALEEAIFDDEEGLTFLRDSLATGQGQLIECSDDEILDLVMKDYVYMGELRTIQRLVFKSYLENFEKYADHAKSCTMVFTEQEFMTRPTAFAFPKNSTLPQLFNPVLSNLVEGGVIWHILRSDVPEGEICPLHLGKREKELKLTDFISTYLALAFGFISALTAFWAEQFSARFKKNSSATKVSPKRSKPLYPKDFLQPQKQVAVIIDSNMLLFLDKSDKTKIDFKRQFGLQFQYLE